MSFPYGFVMSQNKMVALVWGLCTGNHWERYYFTMTTFIKSIKIHTVRSRIHMSVLLYALNIFSLLYY